MNLYNSFETVINSFGMQTLSHPLFYNSKIAIRFNIGDNNGNDIYLDDNNSDFTANPQYVKVCLKRAKQVYDSLKNLPDILVIDGYLYENETAEDFVSIVTSVTNLPHPREVEIQKVLKDDEEAIHIFLCWKLDDFNPDKLLQEIITADIGSGNDFLTSSVYFVCTKDNVLFHLYDDRGADLCAEKAESILHIYKNLNDLFLDYDRERIDSIFKAE